MALKRNITVNWLSILLHLFLLATITLLVFQRHQNTGYFNWRSKMWGDAAGYYVYSPALFIYKFDAAKLPEKITEKTGEGFVVNEKGKIITRYSCGIAILQSPVFLATHWLAGLTDQKQDGFSGIYHLVSSIAAIIYSFFGILLLWYFLRYYFKRWVALLTIITIFLGTNLLYYTIDATGMSHVYSFFLFALLLVLSKKYFIEKRSKQQLIYFIFISFVSSLIILVRPTNVVFVVLVFLLDISSLQELKSRVKQVFTPSNFVILVVSAFIVFLPQMLYWKYSSGSLITNSYEGYGFTNWATPKIKEFLFSTNNGLFTYNPLYFVFVIALIFMIVKKQRNGWYIMLTFAGLIYVYSSWFIFSFGCGFGSRNFVEYTTVFALPLGYFYMNFLKKDIFRWVLIGSLIFLMVLVNVKLTSSYNKCFIDGDWNWEEYKYLLKARKYDKTLTFSQAFSLNDKRDYSESINITVDKITKVNFRRAIVKTKLRIYEKDTQASIVFQIAARDTLIYWNGVEIAKQFSENEIGKYKLIKGDFWLPKHYTVNSEISTFIWNRGKDSLDIKKIKVHLE
ncbi:MAG: hypothetical protein CSA36_03640 [Draconibacterium sp.]|nr:MAG: hypothetical protein CSA36_03640 [Draconibacterium sp.]